jgi:glucose-6-phosphate isomerase
MNKLTNTAAWQQLIEDFEKTKDQSMRDQFETDASRAEKFSLNAAQIHLDYSKNRINHETMQHLVQLAEKAKLAEQIEKLFAGEKVNFTEQRAAWHTVLRDPNTTLPEINNSLHRMHLFTVALHSGYWRGYSGKAITDVVNLGIGGSDLGPRMVVEALRPFSNQKVQVHFVANVDGSELYYTLKKLNPETTLFIIASKTFTTVETLLNAKTARSWLLDKVAGSKTTTKKVQDAIAHHFVAITANTERAVTFGISADNIFSFSDWVGGRYSLWSAIGLPVMIAIGVDAFRQLLDGAHAIDNHFRSTPFAQNMPVILALLGIWYTNFYRCQTQAIIPYDQNLGLFPDYLQQLDMESNGKSVNVNDEIIDYPTAPVIWGGIGTNGQHAFHQLLHQGQFLLPVDFIISLDNHHPWPEHHDLLYANCLAQSQALLQGRTEKQAYYELLADGYDEVHAKKLALHKILPGNRPSNTLVMNKLTPQTLGALIALYEHKVFTQGVIWQINSFDQYGVEVGKQLATGLAKAIKGEVDTSYYDSSTQKLVDMFKNK